MQNLALQTEQWSLLMRKHLGHLDLVIFGEEKRTVNLESERTFCDFIRFDLSNRLISWYLIDIRHLVSFLGVFIAQQPKQVNYVLEHFEIHRTHTHCLYSNNTHLVNLWNPYYGYDINGLILIVLWTRWIKFLFSLFDFLNHKCIYESTHMIHLVKLELVFKKFMK